MLTLIFIVATISGEAVSSIVVLDTTSAEPPFKAFASDNKTISPEDNFYSFHHMKEKTDTKFCNLLDHEKDFKAYNLPENYNMSKIIEDLTTGDGFSLLKNAVSQEDVKELKERVMYYTNNQKEQPLKNLSYTANTVSPGEGGQKPHMDYPYYHSFFSQDLKYGPAMMEQPLALVFITLLTDFTVENGGTALLPNSHKTPAYPEDKDKFFKKAIQVEGKAGDILAVRSSVQHCAMPNKSAGVRSGILIHMGPIFIRPYENIPDSLDQAFKNRASQEMRTVLGLDNPFPRRKA